MLEAELEYVRDAAHSNGIESSWSMMKRAYDWTYRKVSAEHLQRYVNECTGRHNMREMDTEDQMALVARLMEGKRVTSTWHQGLIADDGLSSGVRGGGIDEVVEPR